MILTLVLPCVVIGWLCGSAFIGLGVGLLLSALTVASEDATKHPWRRRRPRR